MKSKLSIIVALLAIALCFSLVACSKNKLSDQQTPESTDNASTQPDTTSEKQEDAVNTMLDEPEKTIELEEFYVYVSYPSEENESGVEALEITLNDKSDPGILHMTGSLIDLNELVFELSSNGDIVKYSKNVFQENFIRDNESSTESLSEEVESIQNVLQQIGYGFVESNPNMKYKKCEDVIVPLTGEAYKYEVYDGEELYGTLCVDKQTGIFVKWTNSDGSDAMTVISIKTTGFDVPEYK